MKCNCKIPCNPCRCGVAEGECRKADALAVLTANRETVIRRAQRALLAAILEAGSATADDVRALVELPPGIGPKCFGAVPSLLVRVGIIRADGFVKTCRPKAHARPVTVWTLVDRPAAERWLRDHPDMPDLEKSEGAAGSQGVLFSLTQETATPAAGTVGAAKSIF
ncbi:MAG: hypothetical protein ABFC77_12230 [Thermoguttaceae bacterium]